MSQATVTPQAEPSPESAAPSRVEQDRQAIIEARARGPVATMGVYTRLSGPGWLQSAITLGGGSLASALYLGVLGGYSLLWLQLLAITLGVVMLGAISYVAICTGQRPFAAINRHINPVLGWGWAIGSLVASIVWSLPQFSLSTAVVQQNLMPGLLGAESFLGDRGGKMVICGVLLLISSAILWCYDRRGKGIRSFEYVLKGMVGIIVVSFIGVVLKISFSAGLPWGQIFSGFIPDINAFSRPAATFLPFLDGISPEYREYWTRAIVSRQQDVIIAGASAAVGINMTFFLPYSMLARGWGKDFKGLAVFDLATGMAIPFILVTSCIVIAAASQFHTQPGAGLTDGGTPSANSLSEYNGILESRLKQEPGGAAAVAALTPDEKQARIATLPESERQVAAMLVKRDAFQLADSLAPLTGSTVSHVLFGIGVLGMGLSSIVMLMVISGFVLREMFGWAPGGLAQRVGGLVAGLGVLGPFVWSGAQFWLAVPASVMGMTLLPIAYFTFLCMMNSRRLLGDQMPRGGSRFIWNTLMVTATVSVTIAGAWTIWNKAGWYGASAGLAFIAAALLVHLLRKAPLDPIEEKHI